MNTAIHIDCFSALATNPVWGKLKCKKTMHSKLTENGAKLYKKLIGILNPHIILFHQNEEMVKIITGKERKLTVKFNKKLKVGKYEMGSKLYIWGANHGIPWLWLNVERDAEEIRKIVLGYVKRNGL